MELPEDSVGKFEDNNLPDDLGGASNGHPSGFSPEVGYLAEPAIESVDMLPPRDQWLVEVVPGKVSDAANRISHAIEIILNAAAHPRD